MKKTFVPAPIDRRAILLLTALLLLSVFTLSFYSPVAGAQTQGDGPADKFYEKSDSAGGVKNLYGPAPKLRPENYPRVMGMNGRIAVWFAAQMHLWFAAFVLAVPIFVLILEALGMVRDDRRYDRVAYEFIRVSITAYSITAITGGGLLFSLLVFYPDLMKYLASVFGPTMLLYAMLFFVESGALYAYYYGWHYMGHGSLKWIHLAIGLVLNASGTALMFIANAWTTFMMSPAGVDRSGVFSGDVWAAVNNNLWNPMNLHRFIANIAYGGSIVGAS